MKKIGLLLTTITFLVLFVISASANDSIQSITFTGRPSSLKVGGTYQLVVKVTPESASNKAVSFSSTNPSVATVNSTGLITAVKEGTTTIKAVSNADPNKTVSFSLTVTTAPEEKVKVQSISLKSEITIYEGELLSLNPVITPSNATDKSYTISGKDYSYSYKEFILGGLLGTTTKTDVCKFSDYIDIYSNLIKGKKATITPKSDEAFYFTVTVTANDSSNKSATTRVKVLPKMIDVKYDGMEDMPWYYGNKVQLTSSLHSIIQETYKVSDIRYRSSNDTIATVTNDGIVTCKGIGNVTISAYIPNTDYTGTFDFYSRPVVSIANTYYESCKVGNAYQLEAQILPAKNDDEIMYYSNNKNVATVDNKGLVTFKANGNAVISVFTSADPYNYKEVWLTSDTFTKPSGTTAQLLSQMKTSANAVKTMSDLPAITRYDKTTMSNFSTTSSDISASDLQSIFNSNLTPRNVYLSPVPASSSDYTTLKSKFIDNVPVRGKNYIIASDISEADVKSITVTDNGDYYYEMSMILKDENMSALPAPSNSTKHGKVFDILTSDYINSFINEINNTGTIEISYSSFSQKYYNSKLTLKINKITGDLESANFDMTLDGSVKELKFKYSAKTFNMNVSFTCNNIVNIVFSKYYDEHDHSFTNYISDGKATCIIDGLKIAKCDYCDVTDVVVEKASHFFSDEWIIDIEPTCSTFGSKSHHCSNCDEKTDVTPMEKIQHKYIRFEVSSTCTGNGYYVYVCSCSDNYMEAIPAKGHNFNNSICIECGYDRSDDCYCNCHKTGLFAIIWKIINIFNKFLRRNSICACGANHY